MSKQILSIANCRVSSDEQLLNNSLKRQKQSVEDAADKLGAPIARYWSGSVSSKRGNNLKRKDIQEMFEYCEKNKAVRYLIVDEPDRFMRSVEEAMYLEMEFKLRGVRVWYASDDDLNGDDMVAKLMKFMKYYVAEGSNEERERKSISGHVAALKLGKYPYNPKPGYKRGYDRAVPEIDEVRGPALQKVLIRLADRLITPTQAVKELNQSDFAKGHAPYKMDKFRKIATDPFYAGVVYMDKQVKFRNENGLHKALITKEQHEELISIMDSKKKNQKGQRKNGNPEYPMSNLVTCDVCADTSSIPRYVGYAHGNGKNPNLVYHKYRCRGCNRYMSRDAMHEQITMLFNQQKLSPEGQNDLIEALEQVWKQEEADAKLEARNLTNKISSIKRAIDSQVEAATDPSNTAIKNEILNAINKKKAEIIELESQCSELLQSIKINKADFFEFALKFINDTSTKFFEIEPEYRVQCKQLIFPTGFYVNADNKVYTQEISPLYRLTTIKKDAVASDLVQMVRVTGL